VNSHQTSIDATKLGHEAALFVALQGETV